MNPEDVAALPFFDATYTPATVVPITYEVGLPPFLNSTYRPATIVPITYEVGLPPFFVLAHPNCAPTDGAQGDCDTRPEEGMLYPRG